MIDAKRTERISQTDLTVLGFIARFGRVARTAVLKLTGADRSHIIAGETRLRAAGLIEISEGSWDGETILACTAAGVARSGFGEVSWQPIPPGPNDHNLMVAELAAAMERVGASTLSRREVAARERAVGDRVFSAELDDGDFRRPDLVHRGTGGPPEAIVVSLAGDEDPDLSEVLRGWDRAVAKRRFAWVSYRCSAATREEIDLAVLRAGATGSVIVRELWR